jgi:type I restriction enzyme S subunit
LPTFSTPEIAARVCNSVSFELLKSKAGWTPVRFSDVVENVNETESNPAEIGLERFIGLEHIEPGSLHVRAWGNVADGTTFTRRCRPGQVLFGKRRAYQRKVAVADFDAVVSGDIYVLAPKNGDLIPDLLPFICLSERFFHHAVGTSAGSLSPRTNWSSLASFEFNLPPPDQQARIAEILWAADKAAGMWLNTSLAGEEHTRALSDSLFESNQEARHLIATEVCDQITVGIVVKPASYYTDAKSGVPALRSLNVFPGRYDLSDLVYLTHDGHKKNSKSELKEGDVVVVRTGRPGDSAVVTDEIAGMNLIDLILVRPKSLLLPEYLVEFLNSAFGRRKIYRGSAGTAQQHFNVSEFERLHLPVPPIGEQRRAVAQLALLRRQMEACQKESKRLISLQSTLREALL